MQGALETSHTKTCFQASNDSVWQKQYEDAVKDITADSILSFEGGFIVALRDTIKGGMIRSMIIRGLTAENWTTALLHFSCDKKGQVQEKEADKWYEWFQWWSHFFKTAFIPETFSNGYAARKSGEFSEVWATDLEVSLEHLSNPQGGYYCDEYSPLHTESRLIYLPGERYIATSPWPHAEFSLSICLLAPPLVTMQLKNSSQSFSPKKDSWVNDLWTNICIMRVEEKPPETFPELYMCRAVILDVKVYEMFLFTGWTW